MTSFSRFIQVGMGLDPIHVGAGGARLGRVDLSIVREPATRLPKIPGSSLAGVYRTYVAMHFEEERQQLHGQQSASQPAQTHRQKPYYPDCAGLGQPRPDGTGGHCGQPGCPVCTVFGFARGKDQVGGFAGLVAFGDAQLLLFPVPTRRGPHWVTCPMALRHLGPEIDCPPKNAVYLESNSDQKLNLGWLLLEVEPCSALTQVKEALKKYQVPAYILSYIALLPDSLFIHIVNSNLEVRTSVSINPETGAAEEGALFSYEALPRASVLVWEIIARSPKHFKAGERGVEVFLDGGKVDSSEKVHQVAQKAHPYLEHLGIGGMGTRGMGRLKVLFSEKPIHQPQKPDDPKGVDPPGSAKTISEQSKPE